MVCLPGCSQWCAPSPRLQTVIPFANRHLYRDVLKGKKDTKDAYGSTVFYDALGLAFSISSQERRKATTIKAALMNESSAETVAAAAKVIVSQVQRQNSKGEWVPEEQKATPLLWPWLASDASPLSAMERWAAGASPRA